MSVIRNQRGPVSPPLFPEKCESGRGDDKGHRRAPHISGRYMRGYGGREMQSALCEVWWCQPDSTFSLIRPGNIRLLPGKAFGLDIPGFFLLQCLFGAAVTGST